MVGRSHTTQRGSHGSFFVRGKRRGRKGDKKGAERGAERGAETGTWGQDKSGGGEIEGLGKEKDEKWAKPTSEKGTQRTCTGGALSGCS